MKPGGDGVNAAVEQKLDVVIGLLQHLAALEMVRDGTSNQAIAKHLRLARQQWFLC